MLLDAEVRAQPTRFMARLSPMLDERVEERARVLGVKKADVVRLALAEYLAKPAPA